MSLAQGKWPIPKQGLKAKAHSMAILVTIPVVRLVPGPGTRVLGGQSIVLAVPRFTTGNIMVLVYSSISGPIKHQANKQEYVASQLSIWSQDWLNCYCQ